MNSGGVLGSLSAHFVLSSSKTRFSFQGASRTLTSQMCLPPVQLSFVLVQLFPSSMVSIYCVGCNAESKNSIEKYRQAHFIKIKKMNC